MSRKLIFEAIVLLLIFASIWGIFTLFPIFPDKTVFNVSISAEEKLGKLMLDHILSNAEYRRVSIRELDSAVAVITKRINVAIGLTDYDYRVYVIENPDVNAFALPGAFILVTTSLISTCKSPEELAAVLAHEMAHIEKRHVVANVIKEFTLTLIMSDKAVLSEASRSLLSTAFDRRQEEEADRLSLEWLEKARINPRILGTFFRRLKDEEGTYDPRFTILSTHPHINSRIKAAFEYQPSENFSETKFNIDWKEIKNLLDSQHNQLSK
ncbi:MAG: M48 family metallopeptidase [Bacteroidales bacterium]|nr:M48 family metallopeptidase [Bacteroidales bacterium]